MRDDRPGVIPAERLQNDPDPESLIVQGLRPKLRAKRCLRRQCEYAIETLPDLKSIAASKFSRNLNRRVVAEVEKSDALARAVRPHDSNLVTDQWLLASPNTRTF